MKYDACCAKLTYISRICPASATPRPVLVVQQLKIILILYNCRASVAASRAQQTLQGAAEAEAKDLASRIANAEAAVEQAEQAAAEAVQLQEEASKAASVAERHSTNAADQADIAHRVTSSLRCNNPHWACWYLQTSEQHSCIRTFVYKAGLD